MTKKICENCKWFKESGHTKEVGACLNRIVKVFNDLTREEEWVDGNKINIFVETIHAHIVTISVGKNFGCVHWEVGDE